jgi:hypothetical protein
VCAESSDSDVLVMHGKTISYSLILRGDPAICLLFKGDVGAVDLRAAWFSFPYRDSLLEHEYRGPSPPNP